MTTTIDRETVLALWDTALHGGDWCASLEAALADVTAEEAVWRPYEVQHSIWQIVNHLSFWHEAIARHSGGGAAASEMEIRRLNWLETEVVSEQVWEAARERLWASCDAFRAALSADDPKRDDLHHGVMHVMYHLGQLMQVRSMLGKGVVV